MGPEERERYQPLPKEVDVVVIGAGVAGCSTAYQLAKRGRRVAVLEKRGICSGASGRNGGMTGSGRAGLSPVAKAISAISDENLRMLRDELPRELGDDFSLRLPGTLDVATTEEQYEHLVATTREAQAAGADVRMLDPVEVRSMVPVVSDRILGAKFAPSSGHLWPFALVHALANGARSYGATFHTYTPALRILDDGNNVTGVETERGSIAAGTVVIAANAWTPTLLTDLPPGALVPARGQILVTQPVGDVLPHPFGTNFDKEYGRQTASGQLLCGGYRRLDVDEGLGHYEEDVSLPVLAGIASCLSGIFPGVRRVRVVRAWAGIMGFTADGLPLIGRYGPFSGLYVAAGFNGGGFSWTVATGKAIAQLICQGMAAFDLSPFDPNRFANGGVTWDNPYTAGEQNNPRPAGVARAASE